MNLGDHVGDVSEDVKANRATLQKSMGAQAVFLKQVHGVGVEELSRTTPDGTAADACVTTQRGLACTIMVADCLPVLLTNLDNTAVAAAHAGWRGLAGTDTQGVLEAVFSAFQASNRPLAQSNKARAAPEKGAIWLAFDIEPERRDKPFEPTGECDAGAWVGRSMAQ